MSVGLVAVDVGQAAQSGRGAALGRRRGATDGAAAAIGGVAPEKRERSRETKNEWGRDAALLFSVSKREIWLIKMEEERDLHLIQCWICVADDECVDNHDYIHLYSNGVFLEATTIPVVLFVIILFKFKT